MSRKIFSILVIAAMMLIMVTGCSQATPTPTTAVSPTGVIDVYAPVEGKTYTFYRACNGLAPVYDDGKMVAFYEKTFNIDYNIVNIDPNSYMDVLGLKLAAGDVPDVFSVSGSANLAKFYNEGVIAKVSEDAIKKYAPNVYAKADAESKGVWNYCKVDGEIVALPAYLDMDSQFRAPVVYRGDWMTNVGVTKTPETLAEFEDLMYKFTNDDPDKNGKNDTYGLSSDGVLVIYSAMGGYMPTKFNRFNEWFAKDGKAVYGAIQPENKEVLKELNKLYMDGVLDPEFITGENTGGYWALSHSFIRGRIGFTTKGNYYHWKPALYENDEVGANLVELGKAAPTAEVVYGIPPVGPNGKSGINKNVAWSDSYTVFGKQMETEPDKISKYLQIAEWMGASTYENYVTTTFGIKGEDWQFNADNIPVAVTGTLDNKKLAEQGAHFTMIPVTLIEFESLVQKPRVAWAKGLKFDVGGIENIFLATLPSETKVATELKKIENEAYIAMITGDKPIDYFETFVSEWNKAGGELITTEANAAYDLIK